MLLESIKMKGIATYNETGVNINDLKKVNIIYGANGSGKTTISKFIYDSTNPDYDHCSLSWQNEIPMDTLVYNKEFRERNFKGSIDGIFTLGEATKDEIEEIEKKRDDLEELKNNEVMFKKSFDKKNDQKEKEINDFKNEIWDDIYKKYVGSFNEAFVGSKKKDLFYSRLLDEYKKNDSSLDSFDELSKKAKTIFGSKPENLAYIQGVKFSNLISIERDEIWKRKIVGKSDVKIAKLIQKLKLDDWVNEGRNLFTR